MNEQRELFETESFGLRKPARLKNANRRSERPLYNVFLAILPDLRTTQRGLQLTTIIPKYYHVSGDFRPSRKFHVTLLSFGFMDDVPLGALEAVIRMQQHVAGAVAPRTRPFEITLDRLSTFGKPLVLTGGKGGNLPLTGLFHALVAEWGEDLQLKDRSYTPHMTLLYGSHAIDHKLAEPVTWTAREMALLFSERGAEEYQILGRWVLGA